MFAELRTITPGHRQRADRAAQQIADALRTKLFVVIGAHAVVHAIHRRCRDQCFGAGDERDSESRRR